MSGETGFVNHDLSSGVGSEFHNDTVVHVGGLYVDHDVLVVGGDLLLLGTLVETFIRGRQSEVTIFLADETGEIENSGEFVGTGGGITCLGDTNSGFHAGVLTSTTDGD